MNWPFSRFPKITRYGFAALALFVPLAFFLPFGDFLWQSVLPRLWLLGVAAWFFVLLMAFRDSATAKGRRTGIALLAVFALGAAVLWWNRDPVAAADAAYQRREYARAIDMVRPLAEKNDVRAAYKLGKYISDWDNPEADYIEGLTWYAFAANNGHAEAAWQLAVAYLWGWSGRVSPDGEKGKRFLLKAVELGQPGAQETLGDAYKNGTLGFPQDLQKAAELLEKAALQGEWNSGEKLYWLYRKGGPGMQPDLETAYFWYQMWRDNRMMIACPDTVEKIPGQEAPAGAGIATENCEDSQLLSLMTAAQIEAARERYKKQPKVPHYNPYEDR